MSIAEDRADKGQSFRTACHILRGHHDTEVAQSEILEYGTALYGSEEAVAVVGYGVFLYHHAGNDMSRAVKRSAERGSFGRADGGEVIVLASVLV